MKINIYEEMISEYDRILASINKIDKLCQVQSTYKWIDAFDKKYKCSQLSCSLKDELRNVKI